MELYEKIIIAILIILLYLDNLSIKKEIKNIETKKMYTKEEVKEILENFVSVFNHISPGLRKNLVQEFYDKDFTFESKETKNKISSNE